MELVLQFIVCVLDSFVDYNFLNSTLSKRKQISCLCAYAVYTFSGITLYITNLKRISSLNLAVGSILTIVCLVIVFQVDIKKVILYFLVISVINMGSEFVVGMFYYNSMDINTNDVIQTPWLDMICTAVRCLLFTIISKNINIDNGARRYVCFIKIMYPVITVLLILGMLKLSGGLGNKTYGMEWLCLLLMATNIMSFQFIEGVVDLIRKNERNQSVVETNALNIERYRELEREEKAWLKREHDLSKNLATIGGLAKENKVNEIIDILDRMQIQIESINENDYVNNGVINALLKVKLAEADRDGINVDFYSEPNLDFDSYDVGDMIAIIGNQFDNAIEGARLCGNEKKIWARYHSSDNMQLVLEMENTCIACFGKNGMLHKTSKKDNYRHGMGLQIIKDAVNKNEGIYSNEVKGDKFRSVVLLPESRKD